MLKKIATVLSFTGGCVAGVIFFTHLLWSKKIIGLGISATALLFVSIFFIDSLGVYLMPKVKEIKWYMAVQLAVFIMAGIQILWLTVADMMDSRDSNSLLLFLWIIGALIFSGFVNWSTNARTILPILPAVAIMPGR